MSTVFNHYSLSIVYADQFGGLGGCIGARGSIFDNERFVHFLKLEELASGFPGYDPTAEAPGLKDGKPASPAP